MAKNPTVFKFTTGKVRQDYIKGKCVKQEFFIHGIVDWCDENGKPIDTQVHECHKFDMEQPNQTLLSPKPPSPEHRLFAVYHQHEYGSTHWLLWSPIYPREEQVVEALGINFEPEKDEFIDVEEIEQIHTLELS